MRKNKIIFILISILSFVKSYAQNYPPNFVNNGCAYTYNGFTYTPADTTLHCVGSKYNLVFEDDFNGSTLDTSKWITCYPWGGRSLTNNFSGTGWEREYYDDSNVVVQNGLLHLVTKIEPAYRIADATFPSGSIYFKYTSGMVCAKQFFGIGKFEIKAKIPLIDGTWPAFWIAGGCAQEIDGFEFINGSQTSDANTDSGNMIMTYHRKNNCSVVADGQCDVGLGRNVGKNLSDDFHIYTIEWDDIKIIWRVDGEIMREAYRFWNISPPFPIGPLYGNATPIKSCSELNESSQYTEFNTFPTKAVPMNFVLNTAVDFDRGNYPTEFLIDYVKIYYPSDTVINSSPNFSLINIYPNPSAGFFTVTQADINNPIYGIVLLDVLGKSAPYQFVSYTNNTMLNFTTDLKGLYIAKIICAKETYYKKIIFN